MASFLIYLPKNVHEDTKKLQMILDDLHTLGGGKFLDWNVYGLTTDSNIAIVEAAIKNNLDESDKYFIAEVKNLTWRGDDGTIRSLYEGC